MKTLLQNSGYVLDDATNVWLNPGYQGIAYNDGDEIETRISNIIKNATDISTLSTELRQHCTDWPSQYHLTSARANILRPFEQTLKGANVLEIGAGCGAISRYLGECGAQVLALEGSPRRASIARSRTRDLGNITVLTEKFDQFKCEHQFDVITLIGVLEYSNLFTPGDNPALIMLQRVRQLLKPEGKLIIAIENQLGLKYFAGAPEDHFGKPMVGIEGRYGKDQAQTFGRLALTKLLDQAGFKASNFLAPFPDYKLPSSIVAEAGFVHPRFDASAFASQSVKRDPQLPEHCNFSLELAWPVVFENGLGLEAANSFLIIASPTVQPLVVAGDLAYHYSTTRYAAYCKETIFASFDDENIKVRYKRLCKQNSESEIANPLIAFICPEEDKYVFGKPLAQEFTDIVTRDGWTFEQVDIFLKRYLVALESNLRAEGFSVDLKSIHAVLPGQYLDCMPQNMIVDPMGNVYVIDKEWRFNEPVELGHLIFRSFVFMCDSISRFGRPVDQNVRTTFDVLCSACKAIGLELKQVDIEKYSDLESSIQQNVSGLSAHNFFMTLATKPLLTETQVSAIQRQEIELAQLSLQISELRASSSWRLMAPMRRLSAWFKTPSSHH